MEFYWIWIVWSWVETGTTRRKTTPEDADLQSICDLPFNSAEALALALLDSLKLISSHLKAQLETWKYCWSNNSKYCHSWCSPIVVETNALQCGEHSHLWVFFGQSSEVKLLVKFVFSRRQEDTLHQKVDRALVRSSPADQSLPQPGLLW